jgi:hypothetical protein
VGEVRVIKGQLAPVERRFYTGRLKHKLPIFKGATHDLSYSSDYELVIRWFLFKIVDMGCQSKITNSITFALL